jgi:hypothetical protein
MRYLNVLACIISDQQWSTKQSMLFRRLTQLWSVVYEKVFAETMNNTV